jgi:hypothetical protein
MDLFLKTIASLALVANFENPTEILLTELLCDWSIFSSVRPSLAVWKMRQMYWEQAPSGIILKIIGGFLCAYP